MERKGDEACLSRWSPDTVGSYLTDSLSRLGGEKPNWPLVVNQRFHPHNGRFFANPDKQLFQQYLFPVDPQ